MPTHISFDRGIKCLLKEKYLYDMDETKTGLLDAVIIGASSYLGHTVTFHVLIEETGGIFSYIPIDALVQRDHRDVVIGYDYHSLDYHLCPDDNFVMVLLDYLYNKPLTCFIKSEGEMVSHVGRYVATFDWPDGNILQHLVAIDNGQYALVPNHKLLVGKDILPNYKKLRQEWI
jgi:hypothetical protein